MTRKMLQSGLPVAGPAALAARSLSLQRCVPGAWPVAAPLGVGSAGSVASSPCSSFLFSSSSSSFLYSSFSSSSSSPSSFCSSSSSCPTSPSSSSTSSPWTSAFRRFASAAGAPPGIRPGKPVDGLYWEATLDVKKSKFITRLAPCRSLPEARAFLNYISEPRANHNCWAAIDPSGQGLCNDDGEPSGTAGRPMKAVLEGQNISGAVVVVTRYFGGTKLGTGGLVKAYSDCVSEVVKDVEWEPVMEWMLLGVKGIPPGKAGKLYQIASDDHFATTILEDMDFGSGSRGSVLLRVEASKVGEVEALLRRLDPANIDIINQGPEPHEAQYHSLELPES